MYRFNTIITVVIIIMIYFFIAVYNIYCIVDYYNQKP